MSKITWIGLGAGVVVGFVLGTTTGGPVVASIYDVLGGEGKVLAEIPLGEGEIENKKQIAEEKETEGVAEKDNFREEIRQVIREEMWPLLASKLAETKTKPESVQTRTETPVFNLSLDMSGLTIQTEGGGTASFTSEAETEKNKGEWCEIMEDEPAGGGVKISEVAWMGNGETASSEWLELKNTSGATVDLGGWQLLSRDGGIQIKLSKGERLGGRENYLMERGSEEAVPGVAADLIYTGALSNEGEDLFLFDATCEIEDRVLAGGGWLAGQSAPTKTMERSFGDMRWYDSLVLGGTPREDNSVEITGGEASVEEGESLVAATGGVRLSEIQAGSEADAKDEFVELINESGATVDLTGWSLTKLSSGGSESALAVAARFEGQSVGAGKHFLVGRDGGYDGAVGADIKWPASYGLAYSENAVILYDDTGSEVDRVSWVSVPAGQSYERTGSGWQVTNTPNPQNSSM